MSSCENNQIDDAEFDKWVEPIAEENQQIVHIVEDTIIHMQPTNHTLRAARVFIERQHENGHDGVFEQYFSYDPIYTPKHFRTRFHMQKSLFERIMTKVVAIDELFQQKRDATGRSGMSLKKCTAAMRVLAFDNGADLHDEYLRMSATTIRKSLKRFVQGIIFNFSDEYLRKPTQEDLIYLLSVGEARGFPGMMGSIDCMHWEWKNCPSAWARQFSGRSGKPTIILEAVASQDLCICHAFFGTPGSRNDINVLEQSPVFNDILEGRAPKVSYAINGHKRNTMGYYLTDGIYPKWAAFVKSIISPKIPRHQLFSQHQEVARKDVERAFGVLQARFAFIKRPCLI